MDWPTLHGDQPDGRGFPGQANPVFFPQPRFTPHCIPINCAGRTWSHGRLLPGHPRPCHHNEPINLLCPRRFILLSLCNAASPSHLPLCSLQRYQQPHLHFHDHIQSPTARRMCHWAPPLCADPIDYFLKRGSLKSARDRIRVAASTLRRTALYSIACPGLRAVLSKILIASSSYPIIGMSRSVPSHRRPNILFIINLKMKLYLEPCLDADRGARERGN